MTDQKPHPDRAPSAYTGTLDFLKARFLSVVGVLALLLGVAMVAGLDLSVPRRAKLAIVSAVLLAPYGYIGGNYVKSLLPDPDWVYLIDLDARVVDGALYRFPRDEFRDLTVTNEDGEESRAYDITRLTRSLYAGKSVDLEQMTVVGTWRGSLDDRTLLRALSKVEECRSQLQSDAQRGWAIESQVWTIVHGAVRDATMTVVDTFESGTLPDEGDGLEEQVDAALERFGLDEHLGDEDDLVDADLDDLVDEVEEGPDATAQGEPTERSEGDRAGAAADGTDPLEVRGDD